MKDKEIEELKLDIENMGYDIDARKEQYKEMENIYLDTINEEIENSRLELESKEELIQELMNN